MINNSIFFKGFHRNPNGDSEIFVGEEKVRGNWVSGYPVKSWPSNPENRGTCKIFSGIVDFGHNGAGVDVIEETISAYIGIKDRDGQHIFVNDCVEGTFITEFETASGSSIRSGYFDGKVVLKNGTYGVEGTDSTDDDYFIPFNWIQSCDIKAKGSSFSIEPNDIDAYDMPLEDVIKSLDLCHRNAEDVHNCPICPFGKFGGACQDLLAEATIRILRENVNRIAETK